MEQTPLDYHTPLPGEAIPDEQAAEIKKAFLAKFRVFAPGRVPNNIPTACLLNGRHDPSYLNETRFLNRKSVFFYMDGSVLRRAKPAEIPQYLSKREPWEDYDICLFDETLSWCVGITHNDHVIVVE